MQHGNSATNKDLHAHTMILCMTDRLTFAYKSLASILLIKSVIFGQKLWIQIIIRSQSMTVAYIYVSNFGCFVKDEM